MKMNSFNTNAHDFRSSKRKCFSLTCCLIFVLLMSQASCRPSETDIDNGSSDAIAYKDKDYVDPDDIDWKNFAAAVETPSKVHPIIYYKEDIVSEDYDPSREKNKTTKPHHSQRKYKEISRHHRHRNQTESYRYIKPEKVYFDINPIEHHGIKEANSNEDDNNKFNEDDIHIEVISLLDDDNTNTNSGPADEGEFDSSKTVLSKRPKKFNHRYRRDVTENEDAKRGVRLRHKRNPYYYNPRYAPLANQLPSYGGQFYNPQQIIYPKLGIRSPIYINAGSPPSSISIPNVNNRIDDGPSWGEVQVTTEGPRRPRPTMGTRPPSRTLPPRRTPPPLLQRGDEDYVTSSPFQPSTVDHRLGSDNGQGNTEAPPKTLPPRRTPPPFIQSGDEDYRTTPSPTNVFPMAAATQRTRRPSPTTTAQPASRSISACIYAISSCCEYRSENIRYQCFEQLGCEGAFWDFNPCADDIYRSAIDAVDSYLD